MTQPIDYITVVEPVHEITLIGHIEYDRWKSLFQSEEFYPETQNNRIELVLSAVDSSYMGIRFKEFSVSFRLCKNEFFLVDAYNSRRLFAWAERNFFATPYYNGHLLIQSHHLDIRKGKSRLMVASLPESAPVIEENHEVNEWKIWLPKKLRKQVNVPHYFHAKLEGHTQYYDVASGSINFNKDSGISIFDDLNKSDFVLTHWLIREGAIHSKSKTMS